MTKVNLNEILESLSGKYGKKHVLRSYAGRIILSQRPKMTGKITENQVAHRNRFRDAIRYATFAKDDPVLWEKYLNMAVPGKSAFNQAVGDFLSYPVIMNLDAADYSGHKDGKIVVTAVDKFQVKGVTVKINDPAGELVEEGIALQRDETSFYLYITTHENSNLPGTVITATVSDNPGHLVTAMVTM